ncbi:MAG TPA: sigma-70 family RNA polymerase sigma factor [Dehalococcoidia bacterium]|nr:sigma-70 family RNA polymerase sigma factor [Dehalococcoidia bacterium]
MTAGTIATLSPRARSGNRAGGRRTTGRVTLDPATLVDAYSTHRGAAYSLAYRILGDGPSAEDAVQDAFIKLWTGAAQFDPARGTMRGLLLTIARHTSIDAMRRRARRQRSESMYCIDATYVTEGPERVTERADTARQVRAALRALPWEQRRAIEMAYFCGLTRREIAASGTVPTGTVKSRMRLGMRKLSTTLADQRS